MTVFSRLAVLLALAATVSAQTYVVDVNNGPGTNFTSLDTALTSVPQGATLRVKPGNYVVNTTVTGKGVTILGEPGNRPLLIGLVTFTNLNANQHVVVKGMKLGFGYAFRWTFQNCQGRVHLEDCADPLSSGGLTATQCPQIFVARCAFNLGGVFTQSSVVCTDTEFRNGSFSSGAAIEVVGGRTRLARCSVTGGTPYAGGPPFFPGIAMNGADLAVLGAASITGGGNGTAAAISGTGTVRMTAGVSLVGAFVPFSTIDEGWTTSTSAPLGGTVTATLAGSANLFGGLVFGFPQPSQTFPDIGEDLWVNPIGFAISGSLATPLTFWLDVPNDPILRGMVLGWQGLTVGPAGAVLTNPAWFCMQ